MRIIDADALERKITKEKDSFVAHDPYNTGYNNGLAMAHAMVVTSPTIDAVPVVRCKDCWKSDEGLCSYYFKTVPGKDFCGDGERRSDV